MIGLAPNREKTLEAVRRISITGRGAPTASALLEDVCTAVAETFEFDSVVAVLCDGQSEEVRKTLGLSVFLLAEAQSTQRLAVLSAGDVTYAFALPLISGNRCHALLCGTRDVRSSVRDTDKQGLATVGVVAATLLEDALARDELQELDVRGSEYIALATHELRSPLASIYGIAVTLDEREDELAEPQRRVLLNALLEQAARIQNLAEQLLDLSRLDLAAIRISPEPVRLRPKIEELVHSLTEGSDAVTVAVPADLHAVVDPAGAGSDGLEPRRELDAPRQASGHRHARPAGTGTSASLSRTAATACRPSSSLDCSTGSRAVPIRAAEARARDWGSRLFRSTPELTEATSSTSPRCRTERDSRS